MSFDHIQFRPSMAPGVAKCPSYMYRSAGSRVVQGATVFSALGSALHRVFELYTTRNLQPTQDQMQAIAHEFNVGLTGYYGMGWRAQKMTEHWQKISAYFTAPHREAELKATAANGYEISGHPDIYQVWGSDYAVVCDLKMGETEGIDHFAQGAWYAWLIWKLTGVAKVYVFIFAPMLDIWETREFDGKALAALEEQFEEWCLQAGVVYSGPNSMCRFCENATSCPAMSKAVDPIIGELSTIKAGGRELTPFDVRNMRPFFATMKKWCDAYDAAERVLVERFGTIDLGDNTSLTLVHDTQTEFDPVKTLAHLTSAGIPQDTVVEQMKISKEGVKTAARFLAVPRSRTHGIAQVQKKTVEDLESVGATTEVPRTRLKVVNQKSIQKPEDAA